MIESFRCKETEKIFHGEFSLKLPQHIQKTAFRKLHMIHAAQSIIDLKSPPSNHLEALERDRKGQYSVRINDQYRICFAFLDGCTVNVEIVDYH